MKFFKYSPLLLPRLSIVTPIEAEEISPIIVTATRTAQSADETLSSVTVIGREEIEHSPARDVAELLSKEAGISFARTGGPGAATSLYLRGGDSGHTLVLIDGVRAASATMGQFSWETLRPEQIERIEVVRGPRASLYGSDAISGVIHIFTRKTRGGYIETSGGSFGTRELRVGFSTGEQWQLNLNAGKIHANGTPTLSSDTENRAYDNSNATLGVEGPLGDNTKLKVGITQSQGTSEHDASTGDSDFTNRITSMRLEHQRGDWEQSLLLGHTLDKFTTHSPTSPATITTNRNSLSWLHSLAGESGLTTFGIDYWQDHAQKDNSGLINETLSQHGLFAEHQWNSGDNDIQVALRHDNHDSFGTATTGSIAVGHQFNPNSHAFISFGNAFKAPTVNDLYWPNRTDIFGGITYITQGNSSLDAEHSTTLELGIEQKLSGADTHINLYRTWAKNLIDWQSTQTGATEYTYQPENVGRVRIDGVELGISWPIDKMKADIQVTLLDAENLENSNQLDRRPKTEGRFTLSRHHENYDWLLQWQLVGPRMDRDGSVTLAGYGIIDASYKQQLQNNVELGVRVNNLLDKNYTLATSYSGDYAVPGRALYLDLGYRF